MATSLKQLFQSISEVNNASLANGEVVKVNPVEIKINDNQNLILGEPHIIVPNHLTEHKQRIILENEEKIVTIKNALKKGDSLILLNCGLKYFVLERR